jgi:hypothetical protein
MHGNGAAPSGQGTRTDDNPSGCDKAGTDLFSYSWWRRLTYRRKGVDGPPWESPGCPRDRPRADAAELAILELLAREAPAVEFEELVERARCAGADPQAQQRLASAKLLALRTRSVLHRRAYREAQLAGLIDATRDLARRGDLDDLLPATARRARLLVNADVAAVCLLDPATGESVVRAADGNSTPMLADLRIPPGAGTTHIATETRAPFWSAEYLADSRIRHDGRTSAALGLEGICAVLTVPLLGRTEVIGVLHVAAREVRSFTPDEIVSVAVLADHAAAGIGHALAAQQARTALAGLQQANDRLQAESEASRRLALAHTRMVDLVLSRQDLPALAELAGALLRGPVLVQDHTGSRLAGDRVLPEPLAPVVDRAIRDSRDGCWPVPVSDGVWVTAIAAGPEDLGAVLLYRPGAMPHADQFLLRLTGQCAAQLMVAQRSSVSAEERVRGELLGELLAAPDRHPQRLRDQARRMQIDLDDAHVVAVARPEGGLASRALSWACSYAQRRQGARCVRNGDIVLMLPAGDARTVARVVRQELSTVHAHPVTVAAAGPGSGPAAISAAYHEALRCLDALTALGGTGAAACPADLGFLGMLLADAPDVDGFIDATLGPVLLYDSEQGSDLARTLDTYFSSGGSPSRAAAELHLHPNTVARRLERVTRLLGPTWQQPGPALDLQLALRLHRTRHALRGEQPAGGG